MNKCSSLLRAFVNYGRVNFYESETRSTEEFGGVSSDSVPCDAIDAVRPSLRHDFKTLSSSSQTVAQNKISNLMLLLYMHALFIKVHPAVHANIRLAWKRDKHSSLFCATVGDEEKAVDDADTFVQFHKTFLVWCMPPSAHCLTFWLRLCR
jgi:hypothetical protein